MKHILRRAAPLFLPVLVWLAFFIAFEPNNYFGLKPATSSTQPVAGCGNTRPTPAGT